MDHPLTEIRHLKQHIGQTVTLRGWVRNARTSKTRFIDLRDGSGFVQCVVGAAEADPESYELAGRLTQEAAIVLEGRVQQHPKTGEPEILATKVTLIGDSVDYPITPKEHGTAFLMENRHLWLRSKRQWAILRVRHTIAKAIRDFFDGDGFTLLDAPILTPSACEGTSSLFGTQYFDEGMAFLSQSGQLYQEPGLAAFGKTYCFGPTFRAEKSKTRRHLTEFWMVEPEVAFAHLEDVMVLGERMTKFILQRVLEGRREELAILERDLAPLETALSTTFDRMTYTDAVARLKELGSDINWGEDFGNDDETILMNATDRPLWVHRFPKSFKAFYMEPDPLDPKLALGADLLAPEGYGEVIGGGERASSLQYLLDQIAHEGLDRSDYEWYLDVRKYGSVPHAGFGLGLERAVAWICKLPHVRETAPYPRMMGTIRP
ncbi:asparagine--tRNA ligase [Geothrix sp. 21YS21S-2]|uniref:asparagine--tRNA ligase n=1 Tax=Geothrix sp. 21YS21S-2 TaxID=3068893 RepID=UPI0027B98583|nr:asparagine--tRNA ligase [Geothrix sp. 21YS21S-2]